MQRSDTVYPINYNEQAEGLTKHELISIHLASAMIAAGDHRVSSVEQVIDNALAMADSLCDADTQRENRHREAGTQK